MKLLYNPFRSKTRPIWRKLNAVRNYTWANKKAIQGLQHRVNELETQIANTAETSN